MTEVGPTDKPTTGHSVEWLISRHYGGMDADIEAVISCNEPPGADCKQICPNGCETWDADHECGLVLVAECNALSFFDNYDDDPSRGYDGGVHRIENGPIEIEFDGDAYRWRYPEPAAPPVSAPVWGGQRDNE